MLETILASFLTRCYPPPAWPVTCTHTLKLLEQRSHSATCHCPVRDYDCRYANQRRRHQPFMWVEKGCSGLFTCGGRGVLCGRSTTLTSTAGVGRVRCNCTAEHGATADAAWIYVGSTAHSADRPGLQAADWPRMAEAWGCPGPESATLCAAWRRIWPK